MNSLALAVALSFLAAKPPSSTGLSASPSATATPAVTSGRVKVRGVELYYESRGSGPTLIILHGGDGYGGRYAPLADALAKSFRVITPDMRGRGRSTDTDEPFTYEGQAEDVAALMDALKLQRAHVLGYSDGGIIGLFLAMSHPDRVDHLAAFGANIRPDGFKPDALAWVKAVNPESWKGDGTYASMAPDPKHWPKVVEKLKTLWLTQPNLTAKDLGRIHAPVLIGSGDHDEILLEHTVEMFQAIPNAQLFVLPGAQHGYTEQDPVLLQRGLLKFFGAVK